MKSFSFTKYWSVCTAATAKPCAVLCTVLSGPVTIWSGFVNLSRTSLPPPPPRSECPGELDETSSCLHCFPPPTLLFPLFELFLQFSLLLLRKGHTLGPARSLPSSLGR